MLLRREVLTGIEAGRIVAVYRRWSRPRLRPGSTMRTAVGVVEVMSIEPVDEMSLTSKNATEAGFESLPALLADAGNRGDTLFRIGVRHAGPDPRAVLRHSIPDPAELSAIQRRLDRLDAASSQGPWTAETLSVIEENPGVRAEDLARSLGREKKPFKLDVRKLKELGLTESLPAGYRLSPRGRLVMDNRKGR
jgi:hypothetical protein